MAGHLGIKTVCSTLNLRNLGRRVLDLKNSDPDGIKKIIARVNASHNRKTEQDTDIILVGVLEYHLVLQLALLDPTLRPAAETAIFDGTPFKSSGLCFEPQPSFVGVLKTATCEWFKEDQECDGQEDQQDDGFATAFRRRSYIDLMQKVRTDQATDIARCMAIG